MFFTLTTFDDKLNTQHVFNFNTIADAVDYASDLNLLEGYYVTTTHYVSETDEDILDIVFTENVDDVFLTDDLKVKPFTPRYNYPSCPLVSSDT